MKMLCMTNSTKFKCSLFKISSELAMILQGEGGVSERGQGRVSRKEKKDYLHLSFQFFKVYQIASSRLLCWMLTTTLLVI